MHSLVGAYCASANLSPGCLIIYKLSSREG
jgi:hypothetical protein